MGEKGEREGEKKLIKGKKKEKEKGEKKDGWLWIMGPGLGCHKAMTMDATLPD